MKAKTDQEPPGARRLTRHCPESANHTTGGNNERASNGPIFPRERGSTAGWSQLQAQTKEKGTPTMRTKTAIPPSDVAQTTRYAWVVVATLIVALILWGLMAAPQVFAAEIKDSDLPFGLQSGLVTAHLDASGRLIGDLDARHLPFGLQSGLMTAHLDPSGSVSTGLDLIGGTGLPFGLQSGLVTAHLSPSRMVATQLDLIGGTGVPFGLESGLVTAHLGLGNSTGTDLLAANPELTFARRAYVTPSYSAANPELALARRAYVTQSYSAANPELAFARRAYVTQSEGAVTCSLAEDDATLAANPELMFFARWSPGC